MKIEIVSKFMCKKNDQKNCCSQVIAQNALDQQYYIAVFFDRQHLEKELISWIVFIGIDIQ